MEGVIEIISNVGFPIAACVVLGWYVKYSTDRHEASEKQLREEHREEVRALSEAVDRNTDVIERLMETLTIKGAVK